MAAVSSGVADEDRNLKRELVAGAEKETRGRGERNDRTEVRIVDKTERLPVKGTVVLSTAIYGAFAAVAG